MLDGAGDVELELIRISTAGSVDDGKSTLLGQLLLEAGSVYEDHYEALLRDSVHRGEAAINLAHITDGLKAEREQNITIDVAYRYLSTNKRRFIIADTPGHQQYTRNMVTGASTSDAALILVDIQNGVTDQTRRHLFICSMLRTPQVAVIVNKMDLVDYAEAAFTDLCLRLKTEVARLQLPPLVFIPTSAVKGDNVVIRSIAMPWYQGPAVLEYMESLSSTRWNSPPDLRIPVQLVIRPDMTFRGYAGRIASGTVRVGDELTALPGSQRAIVQSISIMDGPTEEASIGENVVLELDRQIDLSRGHMLARPRNLPAETRAFEAMVCWMAPEPSVIGKGYVLRHTTREVSAQVAEIVYRFGISTFHREEASSLGLNDIGRIVIETGQPVMLDTYEHNRATGSFILVDPISNGVVAAGMVSRVGRSDEASAAARSGQVVWLEGLSGSGKSTVANAVAELLRLDGVSVTRLDGDDLRSGLNSDLGFSPEDRRENLRRAAHVAALFMREGHLAICSFITPTEADRKMVREIIGAKHTEVFVKASLETCEARDPKGMYKQARGGELADFTGVSASFEEPKNPDLVLDTDTLTVDEVAQQLVEFIRSRR